MSFWARLLRRTYRAIANVESEKIRMSFSATAASPLNPWLRILTALEKKINRQYFDTWFKPTRYSRIDGRILIVSVPTREFEHIGERYNDLILEAVDQLGLELDEVSFEAIEQEAPAPRARQDGGFAPQPARSGNAPRMRSMTGMQGAGMQGGMQQAGPQQSRFDWDTAAQLNPRYTFDAFVIGNGNQFARAAADAERPSKAYNPLFLYGTVGNGKTHLMHAIGLELKRHQPQASICYVTSEKFTNELINSIRYDRMSSFRDKYRSVDVLLIDDIQFMAQKERTQEEFFHTFNALHESMKQIVIDSDRPPKELAEIEDRLRNRFEWGLIADIQPPDLETKVAILQKKAESEHVTIPVDVALFVASNVRTNVRELEGALVRLIAWCSLHGVDITLAVTQQCLKQFIDTQVRKVTIEVIQRAVADQFGMKIMELKQKNNSRSIVVPRQIAMYLAKQLTEASLPEIGRNFGDKHHTTVMHSIAKIDELRHSDTDLNRMINNLMEQLNK